MIYIIIHPDRAFSGVSGGIDFHAGRGSTSSIEDARRIAAAIKGEFMPLEAFNAAKPAPEASGTADAPAASKPKRAGGRKPK